MDPRFKVWMKESSVDSPQKLWAILDKEITHDINQNLFLHI